MQHLAQLVSSFAKKLQSWRNFTPYILVFVGFILIGFGGVSYWKVRILSFSEVPQEVKKATAQIEDLPTEVIIPSVDIDLPVDPGQIKNGVWQISDKSATFLSTSAAPGTGGNVVIYGHNKKVIFGNLPYLSVGQKISIKTKSGKIYNYEASEKYFVGADRVDLVSPSDTEALTIYTCWGVFDQQRVVIRAKPLF